VSLVLEKVENYESRKARMQRRQDIRSTKHIEGLDVEIEDDIERSSFSLDNSEDETNLKTTKESKHYSILPKISTTTEPFNPTITAKSTSLSRMQKFRYTKDDNDVDI